MAPRADAHLLFLLGDPVAHSLSPIMHNAALHAVGLDGMYAALRTSAAALPTVLDAFAAVGAAGNVTVPHKEAVEGYVARKTDLCERTGACNTFWVEEGQLVGDNTDVAGVLAALARLGAEGASRWLILGTGGSARAVAVAARERRASVEIKSRAPERAQAFATWATERLGLVAQAGVGRASADIVINATPLGMRDDDPLPITLEDVTGATAALDLVYRAGETRWVRELRRAGVQAIDGRETLIAQGAAAFERFCPSVRAPVEVMRAAVERALGA